MAEFPALPLFTDAYLADTIHLTAAQHGAYIMLLMAAWRSKDCSLPNDDEFLARIARMDKRTWAANRSVVLSFWTLGSDAKLRQGRLSDERKFVEDRRQKNKQAGRASALKRQERDATTVQPDGNQKPTPTPTPTPTEEGVTNVTPLVDAEAKRAFDAYNETARRIGLPLAQALTDRRKQGIKARLKDAGGLDGWHAALAKLADSPLCRGEKTDWKADLDFMLQQKSFVKLMEGSYDAKAPASGPGKSAEKFSRLHAVAAEAARRAATTGGPGGGEDTGGVPVHRQAGGRLPFGDD